MTDANTFFSHIYEDYPLTMSGFGAKRQTKSSTSKTPVDTHPSTKLDAKPADDGKGTKEGGRSFDKNTDPARNRANSIQFPGQNYSPTNPVARNQHLTKMWQDSIEANTKRMQRMQRPGKK